MAPKKSKKQTPVRSKSVKSQPQINGLFMTIVIFILALGFTLILFKAERMKKAAMMPRHADYVDEGLDNFDPSRSQRRYFTHFDLVLPPMGKYVDNPRGYWDMTDDGKIIEFSWAQAGGAHKPAEQGKAAESSWGIAMFSFYGEYADVPKDFADRTDISSTVPASSLSTLSKISEGKSQRIMIQSRPHTYTRLDDLYVQGKKIALFNVKPAPTGDLGRQDALFTDKGKTIIITYAWKEARVAEQFIPILESLNFDVPAPTGAPDLEEAN
jgi:hypothetical protein